MYGQTVYRKGGIVLLCDKELNSYYRNLFLLTFGIKLQAPINGSHIMLTFREDGVVQKPIATYVLEFELENQVFTNGNAFWVNVVDDNNFDGLKFFRSKMGLSPPPIDFHYCIGYKNNEPKSTRPHN